MKEIHNHAVKWNMDIPLTCQKKYCFKSANYIDENEILWCENCLQKEATEYYSDELFGDDSFEKALNMYIEEFIIEELEKNKWIEKKEMKIQNKFAELIKQGKKTIEIRKLKTSREIINSSCSCDLCYKKILRHTDVEIIDCSHIKADRIEQDSYAHQIDCNFKLVFDGYQRIKVSELLNIIKNCSDDYLDSLSDEYSYIWISENLEWLIKFKHWIEVYLHNEEYCIIYFINLEETFKENKWGVK